MKKIFWIVLVVIQSCSNENSKQTITEAESGIIVNIPEKIQFPSLDSLPVIANLYHKNNEAPVIVLCHQARFNKYEYVGIAKTLHEKGFNCLAIDQRSGGGMIEEFNETFLEARKRNKPVDFLDAEKDIIAAVNFMVKKYGKPVILWGSSYSSVLSLYIGIENPNVIAVIAFSPGNYLESEKGSLTEKLATFNKPMWVTSSKEEVGETTALLSKIKMTSNQVQFIPDSAGLHGSRALWKTSANNEEYWKSINSFLERLK